MNEIKNWFLKQKLAYLNRKSKTLGASSSAIILSNKIRVKESLATLCNGDYVCPNYGIAASCPPHVKGPMRFRKWQKRSEYSIAVKINFPSSTFLSDKYKNVMRSLSYIVATVEQKAIETGFRKSKAFAGGSCKELFCEKEENCSVVAENKPCHYPKFARPSMSGFGVDVAKLMSVSGWPVKTSSFGKETGNWVAGLIMLA